MLVLPRPSLTPESRPVKFFDAVRPTHSRQASRSYERPQLLTPQQGYQQPQHAQPLQHLQLPPLQTTPPVRKPSRLEQLPPQVQLMVFSHLDYQALIHLSTLNHHFHRLVNPQAMASPSDKAQFVMRAVKDFPQHRPCEKGQDFKPGNFECYVCFRVRGPEHFDMFQRQAAYVDSRGAVVVDREPDPRTDRYVALRRFCIECGVGHGLHAPFECLTTKTGRDLWVCKCRMVWAKPACLKCPDCGGDCPLRPRRKS